MSATAAETALQAELVAAIRAVGGRATLGDLMATTARPALEIEGQILKALNGVGGHLAVDDHGEIIYSVQGTRKLPGEPWLARFVRAAREAFKVVFFALLSIVLVAYFVFYVVLLICMAVAAIAAASRGGDCDCDCDCDLKGCDGCGECAVCCDGSSFNACGDSCAACCTFGGSEKKAAKKEANQVRRARAHARRERRRERREERRERRRKRRHDALRAMRARVGLTEEPAYLGMALERETVSGKPPFLRAVRDFIFGPPRPLPDPRATERNFLAYIRAHDGRMTASDAVMLTGYSLEQADAVLLDVATRFDGDVEVTEAGVIVYTFDRLLVSVGGDGDALAWIEERGNRVSAQEFARFQHIEAGEALARLTHLADLVGGTVEHGAETAFVFPADARGRLDRLEERAGILRQFSYCWEELELSPAILGVPEGRRGWIVGFNLLNLGLACILSFSFLAGEDFFVLSHQGFVPWAVGYVPAAFSAAVFLIPFARWCVRLAGDRGRRRRNAHRVFLLALLHDLEEDARVSPESMATLLFGTSSIPQRRHLQREIDRVARDLEGTVDPEAGVTEQGGYTYVFERVHAELKAVEHERLEVDLDALALTTVVYDTAREDAEVMER